VEEYLRLLDMAAPHLKGIIITAFSTGMRSGEILGLRWSHIDRDKGVIRLPADVPKESRAKVIPMNHHVKAVLAGLTRTIHDDFVFTYKGEPIGTNGGFKKSFLTACTRAGIPQGHNEPNGITFHDIRRTVKTNMLNAGVDKVHRDLILGHSLQGMDVYYLAPSENDLHRWGGVGYLRGWKCDKWGKKRESKMGGEWRRGRNYRGCCNLGKRINQVILRVKFITKLFWQGAQGADQEVAGYEKSDGQVYDGNNFHGEGFLAEAGAGEKADIAEADIHADQKADFGKHGISFWRFPSIWRSASGSDIPQMMQRTG
jgi:hypothetical protein